MIGLETEGLELIADLASKASGAATNVAVIELPQEPKGVYGLAKADGSFEKIVADTAPPSYTLSSIDQVVPFVEDATSRLNADPTVWFSAAGVIVILEHKSLRPDLRPRATVPLRPSPEFAVLQREASKETWRDPKQFVSFIRTTLPDAINDSEGFVQLLKSLRSNYTESGRSQISQGRESLGREIDAGIESDLGDIPDMVNCHVRVFDDPAILRKQGVRCVLECNPRTTEFRLVPVAADLTAAINAEMQSLGTLLKDNVKCPVFFGTP